MARARGGPSGENVARDHVEGDREVFEPVVLDMPDGDRAVDRADRGPDDHVGVDAPLGERPQHPDLDRADAGAA
jgi:hypothetical protein